MGRLALRTNGFEPSGTLAMGALARRLRSEGRDIISLAAGEPDFHTAENIKAAGIRAIRDNNTKYTPSDGTTALKQALSRKLREDNGLDYAPEQILVASGTKPILLAAMLALTDPGDEVIIPAPYWVSYPQIARIVGAIPVFAACQAEFGFRLQPAALEAAITPRSRVLILNTPHNPTGAVYNAEDFAKLMPVLLRHPDLWIVTDEIYEHVCYGGAKAMSLAAVDPRIAARTVTTNGFSKSYVMTGWRLGFAAGDLPVIRTMADLLGNIAGPPSSISQAAAVEALEGDRTFLQTNAKSFQHRRDITVAALNQMPGISCFAPEGTFYVFASCAGVLGRRAPDGALIASDADFVRSAAEHAGVVMVPGAAFGASPCFRISYALDATLLETGLDRLRRFCNTIV
jgi:aspartate aminotransferase